MKRIRKMFAALICAAVCLNGMAGLGWESVCRVEASKDKSAIYVGDYRLWSQGSSAYSEMREVGCLLVAQAKMIYESNVKRDGFNPDVWYEWSWANGCLQNPPSSLIMTDFTGPVRYAAQQGAKVNFLGDNWKHDADQIWFNINAGYYTIVGVNGGGHWVLVDNATSKSTGEIYIYDSYSPNDPINSQTQWNDSPCKLSKYGSSYSKIIVYQIENVHTHSYSSSVTKQPTCTEAGVKTYRCSCGASYTEAIAATGHNYTNTVVAPTMTEQGYTLHTCSVCGNSYKDNYVDAPALKEDGYYYGSALPSDVTSEDYTIEYNNHYEKVQKDSPGDGWANEGVVRNEWQNSGGQYQSESDLPTSDARVLVQSVYYHFCGPNAGDSSNYEQTGVFTHYDEIDIARYGVIPYYQGLDEGHPYYMLDWNDGGGRVYCRSGVTCNGSYGEHGTRNCTWYKRNTYQDRIKVEEYKWVKDSGWVSARDGSAASVEVRFKKNLTAQKDFQEIAGTSRCDVTYGDPDFSLDITLSRGNGTLSYVSDNVNVAAVDGFGTVTINGAGTAQITVTASETAEYMQTQKMIIITVEKGSQGLSVNYSADAIYVGEQLAVTATCKSGEISFASDNDAVASIREDGIVTGLSAGNARITVTAIGDSNYREETQTIEIRVVDVPENAVDLSQCQIELAQDVFVYDGSEKTPSVNASYAGEFLTEGTDYKVLYTDNVNAGTASVKITGIGRCVGGRILSFEIGRAAPVLQFNLTAVSVVLGKSFTNELKKHMTDGNISYVSNNEKVAVVNKDGMVITKTLGTVKITAQASAGTNYQEGSASYTLTVTANGGGSSPNNSSRFSGFAVQSSGENAGVSKAKKPGQVYDLSLENWSTRRKGVLWAEWYLNGNVDGYQIQYAQNRKFTKGKKTKKLGYRSSVRIKKLKKGKTYYVRVRAYNKASGQTVYGKWSKVKKIKLK